MCRCRTYTDDELGESKTATWGLVNAELGNSSQRSIIVHEEFASAF